jgi:hypothetical protein
MESRAGQSFLIFNFAFASPFLNMEYCADLMFFAVKLWKFVVFSVKMLSDFSDICRSTTFLPTNFQYLHLFSYFFANKSANRFKFAADHYYIVLVMLSNMQVVMKNENA